MILIVKLTEIYSEFKETTSKKKVSAIQRSLSYYTTEPVCWCSPDLYEIVYDTLKTPKLYHNQLKSKSFRF